jgi:Reverse transcriptase (RNA-dependent DNA polymerase)
VETAFLHGDLDEVIYMDCPKGLEHEESECLILEKSLYGLVQASNRYKKKFTEELNGLGFNARPSDPCLFMRETEYDRLYILMYVDDNLVMGKKASIRGYMEEFKSTEFVFTTEETLDDYLSCEVQIDRENRKGWIG